MAPKAQVTHLGSALGDEISRMETRLKRDLTIRLIGIMMVAVALVYVLLKVL